MAEETFQRLHSTGGIVIWHRGGEIHQEQSYEEFIDNHIIVVKGVHSLGLPKPSASVPPPTQEQIEKAQSQFRGYSFPKGHIEKDETEIEATYREIWEEAGVTRDQLTLVGKSGTVFVHTRSREVHLYLFCMREADNEVNPPDLKPVLKDEIVEARWVSFRDLITGVVPLKKELHEFLVGNVDQVRVDFNNWLHEQNAQQSERQQQMQQQQ